MHIYIYVYIYIPRINCTRLVTRLVNDFRALNTITGRANIFIYFVDLLCYSEFHAIKRSSGNSIAL